MGWRRGGAAWFRMLGGSRNGDGDGDVEGKDRRSLPRWKRGFRWVFSARAWRWRRLDGFRLNLLDDAVFCVMYVLEAVVVVVVFCFYFCRFGCRV